MGKSVKPVEYPDFWSLPPFFTLQPNESSRKKQMQMWQDLLASYCESTGKFELTIADEVFHNRAIDRKLSQDGYDFLVKDMVYVFLHYLTISM